MSESANTSKIRWIWAGLLFVMTAKVIENVVGQIDVWVSAKTGFQWTIYVLEPVIIFLSAAQQSGSFVRKYGYSEFVRRNLCMSYSFAYVLWALISMGLIALVAFSRAHWIPVFIAAAYETALVVVLSWVTVGWVGNRRRPATHELSEVR